MEEVEEVEEGSRGGGGGGGAGVLRKIIKEDNHIIIYNISRLL